MANCYPPVGGSIDSLRQSNLLGKTCSLAVTYDRTARVAFKLPETKRSIRDESWETGAVKKDMKNPWRYSNVIVNIYIYIYIYVCIYYLP